MNVLVDLNLVIILVKYCILLNINFNYVGCIICQFVLYILEKGHDFKGSLLLKMYYIFSLPIKKPEIGMIFYVCKINFVT